MEQRRPPIIYYRRYRYLYLPCHTGGLFLEGCRTVPWADVEASSPAVSLVARQTNVSVARLADWRDRALAGAATALKERERDDRDDEIARLKSKVGEITMDNKLLYAKIAAMEGKRPLAHRRSRR